jgi:hypothetical protein
MNNKLISKKLGNHVAQQLIESITEPANNVYYIAASKHTVYDDGDDSIPTPFDSEKEVTIDPYKEIIFGKKITSADVSMMVPRYTWTSNTVYAIYDHEDSNLFAKQFYAVVDGGSTYIVYKVLDNNNGAPSTAQPSSTSESACNFITTADGYRWKLMYKLDEAEFEKFATEEYMPVQTSANVAGNTINGALDVVLVTNNGSSYVSTLTGQFAADDLRGSIPTISGNNVTYRLNANAASNSDFYTSSGLYLSSGTGAGQIREILSYSAATRVIQIDSPFTTLPGTDTSYTVAPLVRITGDGADAKAYAVVSSNSTVSNFIQKIEIVNRGSNYSYATAVVTGNTGGVSNSAVLKVIVPPPGGHGSDAPGELGSSYMGVSVSYNTTESGFITTDNDYRKFIVIKDPLFSSVTLSVDDIAGTYTNGERVHQVSYITTTGTATTNASCTTIEGSLTDFENTFAANDKIIMFDTTNNLQCLRTVTSVINSTAVSVDSVPAFNTPFATIAKASILATGVKSGNTLPFITMTDVEPKFVTGKRVIGESSGAWSNVQSIAVQEKSYNNWNTFDNRTRVSYSANTGALIEDDVVYQTSTVLSNAYFHSANSTHLFLTSEKGPINADPSTPLLQGDGSASYTLGSIKYVPDIVNRSGEVIYIENKDPISRSLSQSETFKLVLEF